MPTLAPTPTQVKYPRRAALRTAAAVFLAALPMAIAVIPIVLEEMGGFLPPSAKGALAGALAFLVALSAMITRVMAAGAVDRFLTAAGLGAAPLPAPDAPRSVY